MNISRRRASSSSPHVVPTIRAISTAINPQPSFERSTTSHLTKRTAPHALTDIAPETLALMRKYLVAHDTPLYNLARERLLKEIKAVERATGARLGKTCGIDGDDDDGDDDATLVRARRVPGSGPGGK